MHPLQHEASVHRALLQRIRDEFPDADEDAVQDTASGFTSLDEAIPSVIRSYLADLDFASALRHRIAEMQDRLRRYEHRAETKRELARSVMETAEIRKLTEPEFTISLRPKPPAVVVTDESAIPPDYWRPQPAKLDKKALSQALQNGTAITGATLNNQGTSLSVRTK